MKRRDVSQRGVLQGLVVMWAVWVFLVAGGPLAAQNPVSRYAPADIQYGSRIYTAQCALCHGPTGDLIAGVDLGSGRFRRAISSDNDLRGVITNGIAGTAMAGFKFDASELTMIVAYLRNMRDFDSRLATLGEASRGRAVFEGAGNCGSCHRVDGKGPRVAPDLSDIGALRAADGLQKALLDPSGSILPGNRSVRAVTQDGKVISGRRLNEDTHTLQLIDEQERLVSLVKADLREYTVIRASAMPSYKEKLSSQELADMVAYLLTLKGP
jgi:putative heme-binding domain-containing protein